MFRGFLIQARDGGGNYIGSFTNLPALTQTLGCDTSNPAATVTHMNPARVDFTALNFTWQAPSDSDGTATFMYTVVQAFTTFYTALDATQERPPSTATLAVVPTTAPPPSNFVPPIPPNVPPEDYRLTSRIPAGCTPTMDCSYFVGIRTNANSSFLDIYLEGDAQGWVAVGFSTTPNMFSADVLGCNRMDQTDEVFVVDTWNDGSPTRKNVLDPNQDGVYAHSTEYTNGSISCNFSRFIGVVNPGYDLDLSGDLFVLFGRGPTGGGNGSFPYHRRPDPTVSNSPVNPVTSVGKVGVDIVSANLIRAHGILMIIAYPVLAVTAIFIVTWMKPALPNGEWFQIHRAFMIASLFIAALGFVLIFLAFRETGLIILASNGFATPHFAIGITVIALHILNPILAAFRPKLDSKIRGIFKLVHGSLIGQVVQILATTNVGLGLFMFSSFYSRFADLTILWVYITYNVLFILLVVVLLLKFMILPRFRVKKAPFSVNADVSEEEQPLINVPSAPKTPPTDVRHHWILLGVFVAVTLPLMIAVIVLVALPLQ